MTDFLTRLVMHSSKAVGIVRPRRPSLFEDAAPLPMRVEQEEIAGTPSMPVRTRPAHPWWAAISPGVRQPRQEPSANISAEFPPAAGRADRTPVPDDLAAPHHVAAPQRSLPEPAPAQGDPPARAAARQRGPDAPAVEIVERPAGQTRAARQDPAEAPVSSVRPLAGVRRAEVAGLPRAATVRATPVTTPPGTRGPKAYDDRPPADEAGTGSVTVEVTIGRVDVRAVVPPRPASPVARSREPELSLEGYLQGRGRRT